jgi:hypothetical protein
VSPRRDPPDLAGVGECQRQLQNEIIWPKADDQSTVEMYAFDVVVDSAKEIDIAAPALASRDRGPGRSLVLHQPVQQPSCISVRHAASIGACDRRIQVHSVSVCQDAVRRTDSPLPHASIGRLRANLAWDNNGLAAMLAAMAARFTLIAHVPHVTNTTCCGYPIAARTTCCGSRRSQLNPSSISTTTSS